MAYIGKGIVGVLSQSKAVDTMTGDGSDTTLTLSRTPGSVNNVEVYMDGVFQTPGVEYTLSGNTVSFSTAPETGTEIIALIGNDSTIITPSNNSISGTKIAGAVVTDAKIAGMAANKLSGALPAVDGSALTNLPSGVTKNASDPAIDTNPSGGVGTIWANTTSGEMFVLTDATAGSNVWYNVGGGDGDVQPFQWQGSISAYNAGGHATNIIDKFSFTSDGNATDVGDLTTTQSYPSGHHSATAGYIAGMGTSNLEKMLFASEGNATDVANIFQAIDSVSNHSTSTHGWLAGTYGSDSTMIMKFTFASDSDAIDSGKDLATGRGYGAPSQDGELYGYIAGGEGAIHDIDRYSFTNSSNSTDVGTLFNTYPSGNSGCGYSSPTHGYHHASGSNGNEVNHIDKYAFASSSNATDVGNATVGRRSGAGHASLTHGFMAGGYAGAGPTASNYKDIIEKISFASDADATDVGDLTVGRHGPANFQQ